MTPHGSQCPYVCLYTWWHEFELYDPVKKNNEGWERPYKTNNIWSLMSLGMQKSLY